MPLFPSSRSQEQANPSSHRPANPVTFEEDMTDINFDERERDLMPAQYIFTIENLSKAYGKKDVLKNIWLSFYPGAKIGVIGGNGSGKSTLLRIMAGLDQDYIGTARPAPMTSIGYVPQEPTLDPCRDVRGNVEQAVA